MHQIQSQTRPSGHFDSFAAQKYPKILVTIRSIVCYTSINEREEAQGLKTKGAHDDPHQQEELQ